MSAEKFAEQVRNPVVFEGQQYPCIRVYKPLAGWKWVLYWLNTVDYPGDAFPEPWMTSAMAFEKEEHAAGMGRAVAQEMGIVFVES